MPNLLPNPHLADLIATEHRLHKARTEWLEAAATLQRYGSSGTEGLNDDVVASLSDDVTLAEREALRALTRFVVCEDVRKARNLHELEDSK